MKHIKYIISLYFVLISSFLPAINLSNIMTAAVAGMAMMPSVDSYSHRKVLLCNQSGQSVNVHLPKYDVSYQIADSHCKKFPRNEQAIFGGDDISSSMILLESGNIKKNGESLVVSSFEILNEFIEVDESHGNLRK